MLHKRPWLIVGYDSCVHIEGIKKNTKKMNLEFRFAVLVHVRHLEAYLFCKYSVQEVCLFI
jgi:hypothetical protein